MADHELELAVKSGLPEWGGFAAKIEARYKAAWRKRGETFMTALAEASEHDAPALGELLLEDEDAADLFCLGLTRAAEVSDPEYIAALGRAVAGALDDATVDTDSYIVREITKLEPSQLRVLLACFEYADVEDPHNAARGMPGTPFSLKNRPENSNVAIASTVRAEIIRGHVGMNGDLTIASLEQLVSSGFLMKYVVGRVQLNEYTVEATGLGIRALDLMFPQLETVLLDFANTPRY